MAWLPQAWKLYEKLANSIYDSKSKYWATFDTAWKKVEPILKIPGSKSSLLPFAKINEVLQQKELWATHETNVEQILKNIIFHGNHKAMHWFIADYHRQSIGKRKKRQWWVWIIAQLLNYCCMAFEKSDLVYLYDTAFSRNPIYDTALIIENDELELMESLFWRLFINFMWIHCRDAEANRLNYNNARLGFVMFFGKEWIGKMLANIKSEELQTKIKTICPLCDIKGNVVDTVKWCKELKIWRNDIEKYGKRFVYESLFNFVDGDSYFLYGKMCLEEGKYVEAKRAFVITINYPHSIIMACLSLKYLSETCYKCYGEYGIGLKCLKYAYKLCHIDNETYYIPSFVETYYLSKRLFIKKLNNVKCGHCGMKKGTKLRSCSGCMKVMYCNKKCQKLHWKYIHRNHCDNDWYQFYHILKNTIFQC